MQAEPGSRMDLSANARIKPELNGGKTMQIILDVPDSIGEKLQQLGDRLPEVLAQVLQDLPTATVVSYPTVGVKRYY